MFALGVGPSSSLRRQQLLLDWKLLVSLILSRGSSVDSNHGWRTRQSHISIVKLCMNGEINDSELGMCHGLYGGVARQRNAQVNRARALRCHHRAETYDYTE